MGINDLFRDIWKDDPDLQRYIPATDSPETNRFFEDGIAELSSPADIPPSFVTVEDEGDLLRTRASRRIEERRHSYTIRVATNSKALTRQLVEQYLGHIERRLPRAETDDGFVACWVLESQRYQLLGAIRLWRGQFSVTVRIRRPWLTPVAKPA